MAMNKTKAISVVGDPREKFKKIRLWERMVSEPDYQDIISVATHVSDSAEISRKDVVIQPMTNIYARVKIGSHVLICGGTRIGHDTIIGDYCTLAPEVAIAGNCIIGDGVFIGINATIKDRIKIGKGATIGAGAVVVDDVPENYIVAGNPARRLKSHNKRWSEIIR